MIIKVINSSTVGKELLDIAPRNGEGNRNSDTVKICVLNATKIFMEMCVFKTNTIMLGKKNLWYCHLK